MACAGNDAGRSIPVTMNAILRFLHVGGKRVKGGSTRFDRYYVGVLEPGAGYPTADEARKDLRNYETSSSIYGWPR